MAASRLGRQLSDSPQFTADSGGLWPENSSLANWDGTSHGSGPGRSSSYLEAVGLAE